ncbi:hypothetical protein GWL_04330 [Herbaspirillum sp. GW103]|uniref:hypothetical protein n=1 Tax=unclassified Herbaspirillum TaxID=2624150 RepID=UPI00025E49A6|nr:MULTISPECIES: hypothetical protein [unclassified Herbaspirillum]EIJ48399.1 hypothetical protein GWL_04330 [Herbaspirillum sp. GW103]NUT60224.1 hypothetical protein [Herbaspirillum sp. C9C3]
MKASSHIPSGNISRSQARAANARASDSSSELGATGRMSDVAGEGETERSFRILVEGSFFPSHFSSHYSSLCNKEVSTARILFIRAWLHTGVTVKEHP